MVNLKRGVIEGKKVIGHRRVMLMTIDLSRHNALTGLNTISLALNAILSTH